MYKASAEYKRSLRIKPQTTESHPSRSQDRLVAISEQTQIQQSIHPQAQRGIHQLFEEQVLRTPDAIALQSSSQGSSKASSQTLTYAQLNRKANQLAHYLIGLGIVPDSLVPISTPRSLEMVVGILGILKAGAAYVPIDPAYPAARQTYLLQDVLKNRDTSPNSPAPLLLTHSSLATKPTDEAELTDEAAPTDEIVPTRLLLDTDWPSVAKCPQHNPNISITASNLAYVIYTSGSTGNPKGVMVQHRGVINHAQAMAAVFAIAPADRMLQFSSMSFDIIIEELYPTLISGATLVLRPEEISTSLSAFLQFTAAEKITILDLPTAFWHELVNGLAQFSHQPNRFPHSSLAATIRLVIVGGEKASRAAYQQWVDLVGEYPRWLNTYGPTEATVTTTLYDPIAEGFDINQDLPIGRAIANTQTHILNEALEPVTPGDAGELYIGGAGVARGYLNRPEKTAAAFIASPFSLPSDPQQQLYKTGDRVRELPDGNLEFVGRTDFQVKIRGFRIEPGEIESCLEKHPQVCQQIVLAREDVPGQKRLAAYVVMKKGDELDVRDLQAHLRQALPSYMVPSAFVALSALPMTPNGKVDRKALPIPVNQPKVEGVAPRSQLENKLVEIWENVLDVQPVGITDNFFELGGHSLLAMRLFSDIEIIFQRSLPVTTIFAEPTIQQLAPAVLAAELSPGQQQAAKQLAAVDSIVPLRAGKSDWPPLFLVHDADGTTSPYIHLAAQLPGDRAIYGIEPLSRPNLPMAHSRIPDMAAYYIQQMRQVQPHGPYLLGGLCAGGVIAFEMALQLEALGETVALTVLLEAPDVAATERNTLAERRLQSLRATLPTSKVKRLKRLVKKASNVIRYEIQNRFDQAKTAAKIKAFRYWQDRQANGWTLPDSLQGLEARSLYLFAEKSYTPSARLHSKVVLIKAAGPGQDSADLPYHEVYEDALFGWRDRTHQPIDSHQVPGGHFTMLNQENVSAVIEAIAPLIPPS